MGSTLDLGEEVGCVHMVTTSSGVWTTGWSRSLGPVSDCLGRDLDRSTGGLLPRTLFTDVRGGAVRGRDWGRRDKSKRSLRKR